MKGLEGGSYGKEDALSFQDELLIELVEHARKIRRNTGFVALVLLVSLVFPFVVLLLNVAGSGSLLGELSADGRAVSPEGIFRPLWFSSKARTILLAMRRYGLMLADNGSNLGQPSGGGVYPSRGWMARARRRLPAGGKLPENCTIVERTCT